MDKNGSSDKASNRGIPATPRFENRGICLKLIYFDRDGAPVGYDCPSKALPYIGFQAKFWGEIFSMDHVKTISGAKLAFKEWVISLSDTNS